MSFIQRQDLFGYAANFTFNKKGHHHQTFIGGFCSIIIKLILLSYAAILIQRMVTKSDCKNETFILTAEKS